MLNLGRQRAVVEDQMKCPGLGAVARETDLVRQAMAADQFAGDVRPFVDDRGIDETPFVEGAARQAGDGASHRLGPRTATLFSPLAVRHVVKSLLNA